MNFSYQREQEITTYLLSEGPIDEGLREELLDHFCCVIEEIMEEGEEFDQAFVRAKEQVSPNGVYEFEEERQYLLTINSKIMLRKFVYLSGYSGTLLMATAFFLFLAGIFDLELSMLLVMAGGLWLSVTLLPFFWYTKYKQSVDKLRKT